MKFETVLHATIETVGEAGVIFNPRFARFYEWLLRHDEKQREEITRLQAWVNDLHSGMYINCVYCGHRYGPEESTPSVMADVLKQHIEKCPKHPMSKLKEDNARLQESVVRIECIVGQQKDTIVALGTDNKRLQAQVASLERIMERETEKNFKTLNPYTKE